MLERNPATAPAPDLRKIGAHPRPLVSSCLVSRSENRARFRQPGFAGEPIVLIRPKDGAIFALEDRCAHRQIPLSKGVVSGNAVRCGYHGWSYNSEGHCIDVPYLGKGNCRTACRPIPVTRSMASSSSGPGPEHPMRRRQRSARPAINRTKHVVFGDVVACHFTFMHENLMDMNHQFLHRSTTGKVVPRYPRSPHWR